MRLPVDVSTLGARKRWAFDAAFVAMIVGLPALTWYLSVAFLHYDAALVWPDAAFWSHVEPPSLAAAGFWLAWLAFQAALAAWLPGRTVRGEPLPDGRRLAYRMNGLAAFVLTLILAAAAVGAGVAPATFLYDRFGELVTTTNLLVIAGCVALAAWGRRQATPEERQRNGLEAFFVGPCRNPRVGGFDLKFFCEARPGMILWVLIDLSLAAKQLELHGTVSNAMAAACALQILYVADYFVFEDAILTTWDIKHEPFGFMLGWGCLVWVPFVYCLQPLYLVGHPAPLPVWGLGAVLTIGLVGFWIFRTANLQKHRFRSDPTRKIWGRKPEVIETAQGGRLLVSGWWGIARHANYLGDWLLGLSWSLTCGFGRWLPYFYPAYFAVLLIHREWRDARHGAERYGADWEAYTRRVRWRIVPGIY